MKRSPPSPVRVDAQLKLERFEGSTRVQTVDVVSRGDGTVTLSSVGNLPSVSWKQLRKMRSQFCAIAEKTEQEIIVQHEGKLFARVARRENAPPKFTVSWWTVLKQLVFGR